jgi:hypothetical protein
LLAPFPPGQTGRLADMERQRDKWETVATRLSLPAPKPDEKQDEKPPGWWRWLRAG